MLKIVIRVHKENLVCIEYKRHKVVWRHLHERTIISLAIPFSVVCCNVASWPLTWASSDFWAVFSTDIRLWEFSSWIIFWRKDCNSLWIDCITSWSVNNSLLSQAQKQYPHIRINREDNMLKLRQWQLMLNQYGVFSTTQNSYLLILLITAIYQYSETYWACTFISRYEMYSIYTNPILI